MGVGSGTTAGSSRCLPLLLVLRAPRRRRVLRAPRRARARGGLRILRVLCLLRPLRLRDPGMKAVIETLPFFRSVLDLKCDELCMQVDVSPQHTVLHSYSPPVVSTHTVLIRVLHSAGMPRRSSTPPEYLVTFSLRSACVILYDDRSSRFRSAIVSLRDDVEAVVHGFSEYVNGYQRITAVRPPSDGDKALLGGSPPTRCLNRPLGIAVPFSCNNIYHQAFHAVPAFERWAAIASAAGSAVDFVPLIYPTAAVGKKMSIEPRKWHAWEWSIRPFTRESSATIANRTHQLVNAPCVCYDVLHGNADAFNPIAVRSAGRMRAFRSAALANLHAAAYPFPASVRAADSLDGSTAKAQMLLWVVRRHKLRNIDNEAALAKRLEGDPVLSQRVHRLVLDELPLGTQMRLVHACSGLIAVHGQAMAWVLFLASDAHRTAAVEIFPAGLLNNIYEMASQALGVRYEALRAPASPGCGGGARESRLNCNVTVDVGTVLEAVRRAAEYTRTGGAG